MISGVNTWPHWYQGVEYRSGKNKFALKGLNVGGCRLVAV